MSTKTKAQLQAELDAVLKFDIKRMNYEDGKLDARLVNERLSEFIGQMFHDYFTVNGGINFVTCTLRYDTEEEPIMYTLTVQKEGKETLAEQLIRLKQENAELKKRLRGAR